MTCTRCQVFLGNPCDCWRTFGRIAFLLGRGGLRRCDEGAVLSALRGAAGALADLSEKAFAESAAGGHHGSSELLAPDTRERGVEGTPGQEKKDKKGKKVKVKREREAGGEPARGNTEGEPSSGHRGREDEREELQRIRRDKSQRLDTASQHIDQVVAEHPAAFGLGHIPVRGSAGRYLHERQAEEDRKRRPAEPIGAPPGHHGGTSARGATNPPRRDQRRRSRSPRKKSKGKTHRERGREFWRKKRQSHRQG